jgi:prepilin-type N-terminal cleavage/methylation domain-containing protein
MMKKIFSNRKKGFTLVELLVSISIFAVVMVVSMGSILVMLNSNRKSQAIRSVLDNLGTTMDDMSRSIRFGSNYHCGSSGVLTQPQNCPSGDTNMTIIDSSGTQITYKLSNGRIARTIGGVDYYLTSPDTNIQTLTFFVFGALPYSTPDLLQPRVIMVINGTAGVNTTSQSPFSLETMVSQRKLDF